jgi:hypothetical protein
MVKRTTSLKMSFFKVVVSCVSRPFRWTFVGMDVFSKDVCFCQSHPVYVGINLISTIIFERRLLIPFRAKKDVFQENGRHLKRSHFF